MLEAQKLNKFWTLNSAGDTLAFRLRESEGILVNTLAIQLRPFCKGAKSQGQS